MEPNFTPQFINPAPKRFTGLIVICALAILLTIGFAIYFFVKSPSGTSLSSLAGYYNSAQENVKNGNYPKAITDLDKIISASPKDPEMLAGAYAARGALKFKQNDLVGAEADYNQALIIKPDFKDVYDSLAELYRTQDPAKAISYLEKALALDPQNTQTPSNEHVLESEIFVYDSLGDNQKIIDVTTRIIAMNPNNATAWLDRAFAYTNTGKWQLALADFTKEISLKPIPEAYLGRGNTEGALHMRTEACNDLHQVKTVPLDPVYASTYQALTDYCK